MVATRKGLPRPKGISEDRYRPSTIWSSDCGSFWCLDLVRRSHSITTGKYGMRNWIEQVVDADTFHRVEYHNNLNTDGSERNCPLWQLNHKSGHHAISSNLQSLDF